MEAETKQAFDAIMTELKHVTSEISSLKEDVAHIKATMATKEQVASVMIALNNSNLDLTAKDDELERAIKQNSYDIVKLRAAQ